MNFRKKNSYDTLMLATKFTICYSKSLRNVFIAVLNEVSIIFSIAYFPVRTRLSHCFIYKTLNILDEII